MSPVSRGGAPPGRVMLPSQPLGVSISGSVSGAALYVEPSANVVRVNAHLAVLPAMSGPVTIGFSQDVNELFASVKVSTWNLDFGGEDTVAELGNTARVSQASLTVDLEADTFYVLRVERSFSSYSFDVEEATVQVTVD